MEWRAVSNLAEDARQPGGTRTRGEQREEVDG